MGNSCLFYKLYQVCIKAGELWHFSTNAADVANVQELHGTGHSLRTAVRSWHCQKYKKNRKNCKHLNFTMPLVMSKFVTLLHTTGITSSNILKS